MNIKDFSVGQTVYVEVCGDRESDPKLMVSAVVKTVGKKYITIDEITDSPYKKFTNDKFGPGHHDRFRDVSEYSPRKAIYFSLQELEDQHESDRLCSLLRDMRLWGLSLDQMRRIHAIVSEGK